jgi:hypothetical protein
VAAKKQEPSAAELVRQARERGLSLTDPERLLKQLTKTVIEAALNEEMTEHLEYEKHDPAGAGTGNGVHGYGLLATRVRFSFVGSGLPVVCRGLRGAGRLRVVVRRSLAVGSSCCVGGGVVLFPAR